MLNYYILHLFLYFPQDKAEYIPAGITSILFLAATLLTMRWIIRHSKREQKQAEELEEKLKEDETK